MNFDDVLKSRQSCRGYLDKPVSNEVLTQIMEAGKIAPSSCNTQRWMFVAVNDPQKVNAISKTTTFEEWKVNMYAAEVPAYIAVIAHPPRKDSQRAVFCLGEDYSHNLGIDIGISVGQMLLKATSLGLGNVAIGMYDENVIKETLDIPKNLNIALLIAVGYPSDDKLRDKVRLGDEDLFRYNSFNTKTQL